MCFRPSGFLLHRLRVLDTRRVGRPEAMGRVSLGFSLVSTGERRGKGRLMCNNMGMCDDR